MSRKARALDLRAAIAAPERVAEVTKVTFAELCAAYIAVVFDGADTFPVRKPDPKHILMLVERMGGSPDRTVMVGDSIHDVEAAHGAGLPAVLVSWGYTDRPASELGAEAVIQKFDGLPEALQQIAAR